GVDHLDSITQLKRVVSNINAGPDGLLMPSNGAIEIEPQPPKPQIPFAVSIYPNPTSEQATLRLGIPRQMYVRIDVFDALGRRVHDVIDERLYAGDRRFTLPTADWPPGAYFVRIQLDHVTETRRLVVIH
ncbi:MAG: T9SS type A sorting domain-containing protein, partial [Rhodothermales bacterium]|nr:T9SS type A sorting domain-containing protein [Rhodothermales bacterium]